MRLWHYKLLPYLPDLQFKGQFRELVLIMRVWRDNGQTNHLLINHVMDYSPSELTTYFEFYRAEYEKRYGKKIQKERIKEFKNFAKPLDKHAAEQGIYRYWHNDRYLRICMANLYEKYLAVGDSKVTEQEWNILCEGYKRLTGCEYRI